MSLIIKKSTKERSQRQSERGVSHNSAGHIRRQKVRGQPHEGGPRARHSSPHQVPPGRAGHQDQNGRVRESRQTGRVHHSKSNKN
jgi:hypothetical protein